MKSTAIEIRAALRSLEEHLQEGSSSASETLLLAYLYEKKEALPSELADELSLSRGRLSHLLRRLESKGLVRTVELERDRRSKRIELAPDGRLAGESAQKRVRDLEVLLRQKIGKAEESLLQQMLGDLGKLS